MADEDKLYLRIAETLSRAIRRGVLAHGERMPSIRELARAHGVSISTAVQAMRALEDAGLVQARPRSGYYVAATPLRLPEPGVSRPPAQCQAVDLAAIAAQLRPLAHDPDYVSFGAACPAPEVFDVDRVRRAVVRAAQRHRRLLCHYPTGQGEEALRRAIARHALRLGCTLDPDDILVTNGCGEAVMLCLRAVTQPGDVVALESPTYFGFLQILESLHLRALEIPTHPRTGLSLEALELACDVQPVRAVLAVPTLSNPLGSSMPLEQRERLAAFVARRGIALIEDVIYSDLADDEESRRAVRSFDPSGHVMICGSFSKTVAPGIRVGWVDGGRWRDRVHQLKIAASGGGHSGVLELAMAELLTQTGNEAGYRQLRHRFGARVDEGRALVARHFPRGTRVTDPPGGFILWIELPEAIDSMALYRACLQERICIAPGTIFSATDRYRHCIRIGLGGRWDDAARAALARVGAIARRMLEAGAPRADAPAREARHAQPVP